jgi:hypothetical protein
MRLGKNSVQRIMEDLRIELERGCASQTPALVFDLHCVGRLVSGTRNSDDRLSEPRRLHP